MRKCLCVAAPWVPPYPKDTKKTVPGPTTSELGGRGGVSIRYSERIANTPHWKRMAVTPYEERMRENATRYPMSELNGNEFDLRFLPMPYKDHLMHRPLTEVGQPLNISRMHVPAVFLEDVFDPEKQHYIGRKHETVYVDPFVLAWELIPQGFAVYATEENYRLLGLPPVDHRIHAELPRGEAERKKLLAKRSWEEEPWRYTIEFMFRNHRDGPLELADIEDEWDGEEVTMAAGGASGGDGKGGGAMRKGAIKKRKARKIKLF